MYWIGIAACACVAIYVLLRMLSFWSSKILQRKYGYSTTQMCAHVRLRGYLTQANAWDRQLAPDLVRYVKDYSPHYLERLALGQSPALAEVQAFQSWQVHGGLLDPQQRMTLYGLSNAWRQFAGEPISAQTHQALVEWLPKQGTVNLDSAEGWEVARRALCAFVRDQLDVNTPTIRAVLARLETPQQPQSSKWPTDLHLG